MGIRNALAGGHAIYLPSISLVELVCLVEKRRIPASVAERIGEVLRDPSYGFLLAPLDLAVAEATRRIPRSEVPDLPDRVIAATVLALELPLATRDGRIRASGIQTIW
jgi:predicted nucleic acid-binding protein